MVKKDTTQDKKATTQAKKDFSGPTRVEHARVAKQKTSHG